LRRTDRANRLEASGAAPNRGGGAALFFPPLDPLGNACNAVDKKVGR
jgi:hypothetical protein